MPLLTPLTREAVDPALHALWDECERTYPDFRNSWATMAHSPVLFRHVWGQLLALKHDSPVAARHFEIVILVMSNANRCDYCVAHHTPRARGTGLTNAQVAYLATPVADTLAEDHAFPPHPGFDADDGLVIDLARFTVWAGLRAPVAGVHPRSSTACAADSSTGSRPASRPGRSRSSCGAPRSARPSTGTTSCWSWTSSPR